MSQSGWDLNHTYHSWVKATILLKLFSQIVKGTFPGQNTENLTLQLCSEKLPIPQGRHGKGHDSTTDRCVNLFLNRNQSLQTKISRPFWSSCRLRCYDHPHCPGIQVRSCSIFIFYFVCSIRKCEEKERNGGLDYLMFSWLILLGMGLCYLCSFSLPPSSRR